uniref:Uncharacterized protein n=1 Tax=Athene cunicularia TaxID=194338 RepID=A0A663N219_ATHCN
MQQESPSGSTLRQPCASATSAYELQEKDLGKLHRMAARGDLAWLRRWRWWLKRVGFDKQDKENRTPLHLACANGHADVVRFLVQENCQLNLVDNFGRSPLMKVSECQQEECAAILLEHGADPNLADADGNTALHLAVLAANAAVAVLLLEHHANADAQNQEGYTPLHLAVSKHREKVERLWLSQNKMQWGPPWFTPLWAYLPMGLLTSSAAPATHLSLAALEILVL